MEFSTKKMTEKLKNYYNLKDSPIAFLYSDDPPQKAFNPHPKNRNVNSCIIPYLNGVRRGRTLVISKKSFRLCPGGMAYLGFKKMLGGIEHYLSTGIPSNRNDGMLLEGERFKQNPEIAKSFYDALPFQKHPAKYAVFMPLDKVDLKRYKPDLVIFFVNMDQLGGLIQLSNYDTNDGIKIGRSSACGSIITEPMSELTRKPVPRAIIGLLSDMLARKYVPPDLASFTISYDRLIQILPLMDESFLKLEAWQRILKRISK